MPHEANVQRKQAKLAEQALQSLRTRNDVAQSLGQELGAGVVLL
jgi:hypothetical protein